MNHPTTTRRRLQGVSSHRVPTRRHGPAPQPRPVGPAGLSAPDTPSRKSPSGEPPTGEAPNGTPNKATFAPTGEATLTAARSLAAQIERLNVPEVRAASPVKARRPDGSEPWMVWVIHTSEEVPPPVANLPGARQVGWKEKKTANPGQRWAWIKLGVASALLWTSLAVAGGMGLWWAYSSVTDGSSNSHS